MINISMTGTIVLSPEDSINIRDNFLNTTDKYLQNKEEYFNKLDSNMTIHSDKTNTTVEFNDLDLSNLDVLIEKDI